jgi:hypothetical protein
MNGIPCEWCGWTETAHEFPDLYPQCRHKYVPAKWSAVTACKGISRFAITERYG